MLWRTSWNRRNRNEKLKRDRIYSKGKDYSMNNQSRITVTVSRRFKASPERVFDAWLDPQKARQFLFTEGSQYVVRAEIDACVGGSFLFVARRDESAKKSGVGRSE